MKGLFLSVEKGNLFGRTDRRLAHYYGVFEDGTPIAYGGFWLVAGEAQIMRLAVDPGRRGEKKGLFLVASLIEKARDLGAEEVTLEVREHNLPARKTYEHLAFFLRKTAPLLCRQWGRRRAHAPSPY